MQWNPEGKPVRKPRKALRRRPAPVIRVLFKNADSSSGLLEAGNLRVKCALGKGGVTATKREGDGATPRGRWFAREVLYRPDRVRHPGTGLPARTIQPGDGWCDAPEDRNYNRPVKLPYPASAERLARQDRLYDLIVPLGYNDGPRSKYRGSAIFMHVARPGFRPTEGCIALRREDLLKVIALLRRGAAVEIGSKPRPGPYRGRRGLR